MGAPAGCQYVDAKSARMRYGNDLDVDVSLKDSVEEYVTPTNGINQDGPFEFTFEELRETAIAMDKMLMYMRAEVVDAATGVTYSELSDICPTNFLLNTMWKSVECRVNNQPVNLTASQNTAYKSLIQAYTTVDAHSAQNLEPALYTPETSDTSSTSLFPGKNVSTTKRRKMLNLGKGEFEMCGPITGVDFLNSDAYLAPFNSMSLKFFRHEDSFIFNTPKTIGLTDMQLKAAVNELMPEKAARYAVVTARLAAIEAARAKAVAANQTEEDTTTEVEKLNKEKTELHDAMQAKKTELKTRVQLTPKLKIKEFGIFVRRIELTPSALKSYFSPNTKQRYLGNLTDVHSHALITGIDRKVIKVDSNNVIPKQIVVGMTLTSACSGNYQQNPFDFQHFNLNRIALKVNAIRVPQEPLEPDFDKKHYMREYIHTLANTGRWRSEVGNSITPVNFARGVTLFAFDLTPDACSGYHIHAGKVGTVDLELGWAKELEEQITVFIFTAKDQIVTLDPANKGAPETSAF